MTRRRHPPPPRIFAARFQSPVESALDLENHRAALAALTEPTTPITVTIPREQEHAMTTPRPTPPNQPSPPPLRPEVEALRATVDAMAGELAALSDRVRNLDKELGSLRSSVSEDEVNERIVAFLDGLGGVKMSGVSVAHNLGIEPKSVHSRLSRLATAGRITAHREKNRNTLYSVPLR